MKNYKKGFQGKVGIGKLCCPICKGTGKVTGLQRQPKYNTDVGDKIIELYKKDNTLREIAQILELKHPQTVKNILNQTLKRKSYASIKRTIQ